MGESHTHIYLLWKFHYMQYVCVSFPRLLHVYKTLVIYL